MATGPQFFLSAYLGNKDSCQDEGLPTGHQKSGRIAEASGDFRSNQQAELAQDPANETAEYGRECKSLRSRQGANQEERQCVISDPW